ncbi:MAG: hypothetical protein AB7D36_04455 [Oscillospiraceae bacterium]
MNLGDIASVATLILFVFYFLGRIWTIQKAKALMLEEFDLENINYGEDLEDDRENYYDFGDGGEIISIRSKLPILWFHVIAIKYDSKFRDRTPRRAKPVVNHHTLLRENEPIYLRMDIPDVLPVYKVRFQRFDYVVVSFDIGYNGRFGGMSPVNYHLSHTFKSFCYYLFK